MLVQTSPVGRYLTNCHVVICERTKEAIIIDPGFSDDKETMAIFNFLEQNALNLRLIINTHGHPDHTCGNGIVKEKTRAAILIHEHDAHMLGESGRKIAMLFGFETFSPKADKLLCEGDEVKFGASALKVIHTPGHSHGSISLLGKKLIFTGDTLFQGSIGRIDFPESSEQEMMRSLETPSKLPSELVIYPGHGPKTTIADEKLNNPFMKPNS
jgi:hydroxyacylglutathione hydrolase